ncbi:hypothetical protein BH10ACT1_BH10ACT1_36610 [soil metagenome]
MSNRSGFDKAIGVIEGIDAIRLAVCFVVLFALVLLRGAYSGYRVGGVLLALAVLVGFVLVTVVAIGDAFRRRWSRRSVVVLGGYGAAVVSIIAVDVLTS